MRKAFGFYLLYYIFLPVAYTQSNGNNNIHAWLTTANGSKRLEKQHDMLFAADAVNDKKVQEIFIDDKITYQEMDGFGAAMTGTSAYVLNRMLEPGKRDSLMKELFGSDGIGLSFIRQMIGASGYEIGGDYSYDDISGGKTDLHLENFSIEKDKHDVVPMLKIALANNSSLKIFGSPCSAPGWMKNTGSMRGTGNSYLQHKYYPVYAQYFVKYIRAYTKEGLPIFAVTIQNEPEYGPTAYPGMIMTAKEQADFIKNHLGPAFTKEKISARIIIFDHNWASLSMAEKGFKYPLEVLDDPLAYNFIAGTGFHNYGGSPELQSFVHDKYPEKDIWFTEGSGGKWIGGFKETIREFVSRVIIGSVRNWSKGVCLWNLALDKGNMLQKSKDESDQNCADCYGLVTIDTLGNIERMPEFYALAHASKFVKPGANRIASNTFQHSIENVAFKNPDGSIVLLAINMGKDSSMFKVKYRSDNLLYTLAAGDVVTLVWDNAN
ncbi:MAG: hypothetical protein JST21_00420 [Bacteroidetes bacterium]|nr:hypothetical protein [Bacteroidota bacterium]MBS1744609.1 hypothetical protein [Bacteroidota bacterium]